MKYYRDKIWPNHQLNIAAEHGIDVDGNGAIYGLRGWNRYKVTCLGEIVFLSDFACPQSSIEKAKQVGFKVG